ELRVALAAGVPSVVLGGSGAGELLVTAVDGLPIGTIPSGASWTVIADSVPGRLRILRPAGADARGSYAGIVAVNLTEGRFAVANGRRYRGRLAVYPASGGTVTVINRVGLESYVAGVVGPEIGPRRPNEEAAVLAQAVVSRSFALRNRGRWESLGFDAYADVRDQVYLGVSGETPQVWSAIRRTAGQVLRHGGQTIDAYFHSTCGYRTAAVEEAFATARPRSYLRSISDERGGGRYYCDISPRFRWREEWDGPELRAILTRTLPAVMSVGDNGLPRVTNVTVSRTTRSGRVGELRIVFERGDVRIPGHLVRQILRPDGVRILRSGAFQLTVEHGAGGEVSRLVAAGAGSGHGVGMCQWGAIGRARAGQDYRKILTTYFPGTQIERAY
ncbi:MAG: SpoIID/LytB domain-containing protein, partial [Gemmatimonadales bacterium]